MTNQEIKREWNALSGEEMYNKIERACREVIRQRPNMAKAACISASELAGDAWIRIDSKINGGADALSVDKLVIIAASEALTAAARFNAHSVGGSGLDGAGEVMENTQADSLNEKLNAREEVSTGIKRPVENAVVTRAAIDAAAADKRDADIIRGLKHGLNNAEIAAKLGITPAAVTQRKNKIADRISATIDAEASDAVFEAIVNRHRADRERKASEAEHYKAGQMRNKI